MLLPRFLVRRFSRMLNAPPNLTRKGQPIDKDRLGRMGEDIAARYLYAHGCKILYRNYKGHSGGELDIVCRCKNLLLFVEVKTRRPSNFGRPADAVNLSKQFLIARGAKFWLRMLDDPNVPYRCDIVEVILDEKEKPNVNWIQGAFKAEPDPRWRTKD